MGLLTYSFSLTDTKLRVSQCWLAEEHTVHSKTVVRLCVIVCVFVDEG